MRYILIGLLCLLVLQGCSSGSGGGTVSPPQGHSRAGGGDHSGGHR
jgi:hypothetical protein